MHCPSYDETDEDDFTGLTNNSVIRFRTRVGIREYLRLSCISAISIDEDENYIEITFTGGNNKIYYFATKYERDIVLTKIEKYFSIDIT